MGSDAYRDSVRRLFASCLDHPASSVLVVGDPFSGLPIALLPATSADRERTLVSESAWSADGPGPLPVLADLVACSVIDEPHATTQGGSPPVAFTPALRACEVHVLPAGEVLHLPGTIRASTGVPPGPPLPRTALIELRSPGGACLYLHEGHLPDGSPFRVSALHVLDPPARSLPDRVAL